MSEKFFKGVVGEQAEKSAKAGAAMAKKSGSRLWTSVCDGILADTLARQGKAEESQKAREEATRRAGELPTNMRRRVEE